MSASVPVGAMVVTVAFRRGGRPRARERARRRSPGNGAALARERLARGVRLALRRTPSPRRRRASASGASYGSPSRTSRSAQPITPSPILRLRREISAICGSGQTFTSSTSSRKRTPSRTHAPSPSQSTRPPRSKRAEVHRAERARLERQERLLAARVHRLEAPEVRASGCRPRRDRGRRAPARRTPTRTRRSARAARARRPSAPPRRCAGGGAATARRAPRPRKSASGAATERLKFSSPAPRFASTNSSTSGCDGREHRHVRAAPDAALLDDLGRRVVDAHERDRPARDAVGGLHDVAARPQAREREAGAAARLVDERRPLQRVEDAGEVVLDRQHEAGGELPVRAARRS